DVMGRLGPTELIILAPHTDAEGAARLARRISELRSKQGGEAVPPADEGESRLRPCIGYCAVPSFRDSRADPVDLLVKATMALRRAQTDAHRHRICASDLPEAAPAAELG